MRVLNLARQYLHSGIIAAAGSLALIAAPVSAQSIESIDPDAAMGEIDGDLSEQPGDTPIYADEQPVIDVAPAAVEGPAEDAEADARPSFNDQMITGMEEPEVAPTWANPGASGASGAAAAAAGVSETGQTYKEDDLIGAAQDVFGRGAEGVAGMIQDLLSKQGEPNAYIVGREAGGAFIVGARYGSGTLYHKVEGERPVYWTGPSIGFDAGANAGNTFVLVYNLYDSEELYKRFPAGEGQAYIIGGMTASYMRRGDTVLIPIRVGAGLRLGVNAGYMRFSKKQRWLPF